MPAAEVPELIAYLEREPVWPNMFRQMFAAFFSIVCNLLRNISNGTAGTKIRTGWNADDFLGNAKPVPPSPKELETKLHILRTRVNSQKKRGAK